MGTRSASKGTEPPITETGSSYYTTTCRGSVAHVNIGTQKRKAKDTPLADQPAKRSNRKGLNTKQARPLVDTGDPREPIPGTNARTTEPTPRTNTETVEPTPRTNIGTAEPMPRTNVGTAEPTLRTNVGTADKSTPFDLVCACFTEPLVGAGTRRTGIRKAPARPTPSSDSDVEEDGIRDITTDGS